jgi:hypothetical protein
VEELSPSMHGSVDAVRRPLPCTGLGDRSRLLINVARGKQIPNGYANAEEIVPDPNDPTTFVDEETRQRVIEYLGVSVARVLSRLLPS